MFKTAEVYKLQPVLISKTTANILEIWLLYIMPRLRPNSVDTDSLFVNIDGDPVLNLHQYYARFLLKYLSIHFTTTTMRALTETASQDAYNNNLITLDERLAVQVVNGHSGAISKAHYEKYNFYLYINYILHVISIEKICYDLQIKPIWHKR